MNLLHNTNMDSFFKAFGNSKIPSLLLLVLLFSVGAYLITDETAKILFSISSVTGAVLITVAVTLSIFAFADYRKREEADGTIKSMKTAMESISKTHSVFEKSQQTQLSSQKIGEQYTVEGQEKTLDN
jgi:glucan phosphoethanolaminetransferase (alkaline phosphatase superfamily)